MEGLGVMLGYLGGNEKSVKAYKDALNKTIKSVAVQPDKGSMVMEFEDGTAIAFYDAGQSCCEQRFMTCDDELTYYAGSVFTGAEIKEGPTDETDGEPHDQEFLIIKTSKGEFTVANHNEHNGYYGGFLIRIKPATKKEG